MPETSRPDLPPPPRFELSAFKILAGALAAASAAVASSWLGVAGTVFGAVVVSVVATVGTALYSHSLERSRYAFREQLPAYVTTARMRREGAPDSDTLVMSVADADPRPHRERRPRGTSWGTVLVSCLATLVLCFGVLTGFEEVVGRSAADLTGSSSSGGTTLGSLVNGGWHHTPSHGTGPTTPGAPTPTSPTSPSTPTAPTSPTTPTGPTTTAPTSISPTSPTGTDPTSTEPTQTGPTDTGTGSTATEP